MTAPHRRLAALAAAVLAAGLTLTAHPGTGSAVPISGASTSGSAVTVPGTGPFAALRVSVSQTADLINQAVSVSWTGGVPTQPASGQFALDYLQLMQCWGDDAAGPRREQCQFGGLVGESRGGAYAAKRQVSYGAGLVDPLETYKPPAGSFENAYVPFESVTGKTTTGPRSEFFDASTTNEVPFGRTRTDGTGEEFFEVQTATEAPGLGCGTLSTASGRVTTGRPCWLVAVPRGNTEVDGSVRSTQSDHQLDSSPLSATNWAHRIVVPLRFQPVGRACPIGGNERRTVGQEMLTEAVARWQPALCAGGGTVFGFSQVSDPVARRQVQSKDPGMVFLSRPVPRAEVSATRPVVYAPVAVSGLTFAFDIERRARADASDVEKRRDGQRMTALDLTPRLVAKLLTQSYRAAVAYSAPYLATNPGDLTRDPDFLAVNPGFADQFLTGIPDLLTSLGESDVTTELWSWIQGDADARAFVDGKPDPWGMTVNPRYKGLSLPIPDFPKSDLYCDTLIGIPSSLCALDAHPYAADMHDAARSTSRGDTLARTTYDLTGTPPGWKKSPPQPGGQRSLLAVTDAATAARYGLPTARLRNASGAFVAIGTTSLLAGVAAMKPGEVPGVLEAAPLTSARASYPLTTVTYAATPPSALTAAAGRDYAALLRYAAGKGQVPGVAPGTLPLGYAPLPAALRTQTISAAATIAARAGVPVVGTGGAGQPGFLPDPTKAGGVPGPGAGASSGTPPVGAPPAGAAPSAAGGSTGATPPALVAVRGRTAAQPVGAARYAVLFGLLLGGLAACAGPVLLRLAAARGGEAPAEHTK